MSTKNKAGVRKASDGPPAAEASLQKQSEGEMKRIYRFLHDYSINQMLKIIEGKR